MNTEHVLRKSEYIKKAQDGRVLGCTLTEFDDRSVYLDGDEIEVGFEFADDAVEQAIAYLHKHGYELREGSP